MEFDFKKYVKLNWRIVAVLLLAVCFFIGTSSYNYLGQENNFIKWSSPDETANYFFAKLYAEKGELKYFEQLNLYVDNIIHPRSMRSDAGEVKPVSFLGIILIFGAIAKLTSVQVLPYLTPFFGAVGIVFFYLFVKKIFGRENAFLSTFLLASFPPFIYYSARSMFHNVLFVVLVIIGLYYILLMIGDRKGAGDKQMVVNFYEWSQMLYAALAGGLIGLAIITRTSELIWILPMLFIIWIFNVKKIGFAKIIIFLSFLFLSILPMLYWNNVLYGSAFNMGYMEESQPTVENIAIVESASPPENNQEITIAPYREFVEKIKNGISLFGFAPRHALRMLKYYFAEMFPWLFWGAFFGFLIFLWKIWKDKKWKRTQIIYFLSYFIISFILIFYYGSWEIHDNPDPNSITIGNSYTRYWLPVYLGAIPLAGALILKLAKLLKNKIFIAAGRFIIIAAIFIISIQFVLTGSEEGLIFSLNKRGEVKYEFNKVLELTEENSVIITEYHDKLFFPERKVIVGLFDNQEMNQQYARLTDYTLVYYYNFTLPQRDIDYLNNKRLKEVELFIGDEKKITNNFSLYKLYRVINKK